MITKKTRRGLALDIDDTLSWTVKHYIDILKSKFGNPEGLTTRELLDKYRYINKIPYWQTPEALKWIERHFYSNETFKSIPLIEDASVIVRKISEIIPIRAYITARSIAFVDGTKQWLKKNHFPEAEIFARPLKDRDGDGSGWKANILVNRYPEICAIVDDNKRLIEALPSSYEGTVYLYGHSSLENSSVRTIPCKTWRDVLLHIKKDCGNDPIAFTKN